MFFDRKNTLLKRKQVPSARNLTSQSFADDFISFTHNIKSIAHKWILEGLYNLKDLVLKDFCHGLL